VPAATTATLLALLLVRGNFRMVSYFRIRQCAYALHSNISLVVTPPTRRLSRRRARAHRWWSF
jgi:hypothetical protein